MDAILKEVIYLLYSARFRSEHIVASFSYEADRHLLEQASERFMNRTSAQPMWTYEVISDRPQQVADTERLQYLWEIWWQKPWFWRVDRTNLQTNKVKTERVIYDTSIVQASKYQVSNSAIREEKPAEEEFNASTEANKAAAELSCLDPSFLLSSHELEVLGSENYMQRQAYKVSAKPRPDREAATDQVFWSSADSYELLVDAEMGILLAYTGYMSDIPFARVSLKSVSFDSPIAEEVFRAGTDEAQ